MRFVIESQCDDRERDTDRNGRVLVSSTTTTSRYQAPNTHYISHRLNDGGYYNESIQISVLYFHLRGDRKAICYNCYNLSSIYVYKRLRVI